MISKSKIKWRIQQTESFRILQMKKFRDLIVVIFYLSTVKCWYKVSLGVMIIIFVLSVILPCVLLKKNQLFSALGILLLCSASLTIVNIIDHIMFTKTWKKWWIFCQSFVISFFNSDILNFYGDHKIVELDGHQHYRELRVWPYWWLLQPGIRATYSGFVASLLEISLSVLLITVSNYWRREKLKTMIKINTETNYQHSLKIVKEDKNLQWL